MKNIGSRFNFAVLLVLLFGAFAASSAAFAQNSHFLEKGRIYYEKKVNQHARYRPSGGGRSAMNFHMDELLRNSPQFRTTYHQLDFNKNTSLYQVDPNKKEDRASGGMVMFSSSEGGNAVFKDYDKNEIIQQRSYGGESVLIQDSLPPVIWRITGEYREIAGYSCRRANGLIMDSIYVVAFYSDQIASQSGPAAFGGLPGAILGLAIPDYNTTWFATKVEYLGSTPNLVPPEPKKAVKFTRKSFMDQFRMGGRGIIDFLF